jgi:phosphoribosylformimino-5-aminoimidazole carboxamide ribotide isomerase
VRLRQGDFARETVYGGDPVAVAQAFAAKGAVRLHVVDLDGAREGRPSQAALMRSVVESVAIPVQVAGGMRDPESVEAAFGFGADRVVLGSALLARPWFAAELVSRYGYRLVAALDVRDGLAVGEAWRHGASGVPVLEAAAGLAAAGVSTFAVTAVARDGALGGPDLALLERVLGLARDVREDGRDDVRGDVRGDVWSVPRVEARVIASGGVSSPADIVAVRALGCAGVILGRALYEGRLSLGEAIAAAGS